MASLLIVEDDPVLRAAMIQDLSQFHVVRSVSTALAAIREVTGQALDLVTLDLGLPDLDGRQALQMIRTVSDVPVLVITARDDEAEIAETLRAGADDYIVKPFSGDHLQARVLALLRRSGRTVDTSRIRVGGLDIDLQRRTATLDGNPLELARREFDLLSYLAQNVGRVVSRQELMTHVWQEAYLDQQTIDVHLSWLRRKLGERPAEPRFLHTVRGVGVMLDPPAEDATPG